MAELSQAVDKIEHASLVVGIVIVSEKKYYFVWKLHLSSYARTLKNLAAVSQLSLYYRGNQKIIHVCC